MARTSWLESQKLTEELHVKLRPDDLAAHGLRAEHVAHFVETALQGVTVTVSSPSLQGTRKTTTGPNGVYNFGALPPGDYTIAAYAASVDFLHATCPPSPYASQGTATTPIHVG